MRINYATTLKKIRLVFLLENSRKMGSRKMLFLVTPMSNGVCKESYDFSTSDFF